MTTEQLLHDAWVIAAIASTFAAWGLLLAVIVDNAHTPAALKPHMLVRMAVYTGVIPANLAILFIMVAWR